MTIKAGIVGGTGYTGAELLRLLSAHPDISLQAITSRSHAGTPVDQLFANLRGVLDLPFSDPTDHALLQCDVVFYATPNGTAMQRVPELLAAGVRVIDLAADFRLRDAATWQTWYGQAHACPELLEEAVYGLPELNRAAIRQARLVANPGCYATAAALALLPLVEHDCVETEHLIVDGKSGVSGAGRNPAQGTLLCEASENFKAYAASGHRHRPEICQTLRQANPDANIQLCFVPHLVPMIRGIEVTAYATIKHSDAPLQAWFEQRYANEPCVDVMPQGAHPETRTVRGTNVCRLALHCQDNTVIVSAVIDNLVKGAAGQAVQNLNLMFGLEERRGLDHIALLP